MRISLPTFFVLALILIPCAAQAPANRTACSGRALADGAFEVECTLDGKPILKAKSWIQDPGALLAGFHAPGIGGVVTETDPWPKPLEAFTLLAVKRSGQVLVSVAYNDVQPAGCPWVFPRNQLVFPTQKKSQ